MNIRFRIKLKEAAIAALTLSALAAGASLAHADASHELMLTGSASAGTWKQSPDKGDYTGRGFDIGYTLYISPLKTDTHPEALSRFLQHPDAFDLKAGVLSGEVKASTFTYTDKFTQTSLEGGFTVFSDSRRWSTGFGLNAGETRQKGKATTAAGSESWESSDSWYRVDGMQYFGQRVRAGAGYTISKYWESGPNNSTEHALLEFSVQTAPTDSFWLSGGYEKGTMCLTLFGVDALVWNVRTIRGEAGVFIGKNAALYAGAEDSLYEASDNYGKYTLDQTTLYARARLHAAERFIIELEGFSREYTRAETGSSDYTEDETGGAVTLGMRF